MNNRALAILLLLAGIAAGQTKPAPAPKPKPETPHLVFVREYVRELMESESLIATGEKEISQAKTPNEQFSALIYASKSIQLELRSQIGMLKSMRLNDPFDSLIPDLIRCYQRQIELHQELINISGKFLAGPKAGVDYEALAAKVPEIRAELDAVGKTVFEAAGLVFMTLIDPTPDSQDHLSHLLITKAEKADLQDQLDIMLKDEPDEGDHSYYISAALVLRGGLQKGTSAPMNLGNRHLPDSTGRSAPNQFNSGAAPEVRSHFQHKRVGVITPQGDPWHCRRRGHLVAGDAFPPVRATLQIIILPGLNERQRPALPAGKRSRLPILR